MKFLIWFGCIFALSLITVLLKYAGILLGFIPTFILGSLMFWSARTLCKKWDKHKENKNDTYSEKVSNGMNFKESFWLAFSTALIPFEIFLSLIATEGQDPEPIVSLLSVIIFCLLIIMSLYFLMKKKAETKISLIILSVLSAVSPILSMIFQDAEKCLYEATNPTIFYMLVVIVNVILLTIMSIKRINRYKFIPCLLVLFLGIISVCAFAEGSVFSLHAPKNWKGTWNYYENVDLVYAIDMLWVVSSFVMCGIVLLTMMSKFSQTISKKYYSSLKYREKCYKKVADMQMYLEKGIITQEEFENNKNDILKKIKSEPSDYSRKTAVENTKEFDENKTILNMQEPKESVEPVVRDDAFWEKVKMIYSNLYQENGQVFYQSLAKAELLNFNEKTKNFELNIFDDEAMQRSSIYGAEFDRFIGYVFKSWMQHKIPEMDANEMIKITEIMSSHFNIDDPYVKEIAPDTINRWNDFDKINIDEYLYGFYEGTGHKVEPDEKIEEDSREILATYDAMRWIMTDLIYTTSKTSKTFSYDKTVEYLKENHIMWKDSDDKDATLESMKMIDIYCNLSDIYVSVIQTVNWIASNEFMK